MQDKIARCSQVYRPLVSCANRSHETGTECWKRAIFSVRFHVDLQQPALVTPLSLVNLRLLSVITHRDAQNNSSVVSQIIKINVIPTHNVSRHPTYNGLRVVFSATFKAENNLRCHCPVTNDEIILLDVQM